MIPIQQLLSRIEWDADFGKGAFEIGYFDRVEDRVVVVPFCLLSFPEDRPGTFQLTDAYGKVHRIPFHRVREVWREGVRIWQRPEQT